MSPHYDRSTNLANPSPTPEVFGASNDAMEQAAEALRHAEVEAAVPEAAELPQPPDPSNIDSADLERMSIDELRALAAELHVPERSTITDQDDLIAAIARCLPNDG